MQESYFSTKVNYDDDFTVSSIISGLKVNYLFLFLFVFFRVGPLGSELVGALHLNWCTGVFR